MIESEAKQNHDADNQNNLLNISYDDNISTRSINWMEKLKPSSRNKLIQKRYRALSFNSQNKLEEDEDLLKYGIDLNIITETNENIENLESQSNTNNNNNNLHTTPNTNFKNTNNNNNNFHSNNLNTNYLQKWNKCVVQSKLHNLKIDISDANNQSVLNFGQEGFEMDNSIQCFEEIGNFIEEKVKINYNEDMFLKQQEHHSIIPFILIHSKEVHRVCLSDYEIKHTYKSYKTKSKSFRAEAFDFYRIGLINFYKGKYQMAYNSFKNAINSIKHKQKEPNIIKWFLFTSIVILFCDYNKLDFNNIKKIKIEETENSVNEEDGFSFFSCCSSRKQTNEKIRNVQMEIVNSGTADFNNYLTTTNQDFFINFNLKNNYDINLNTLAKDILDNINYVIDKNNSKSLQIEGWWILLLISTYTNIHKNQKLFTNKLIYEPKYCIKRIKELDDYLSYIAYAQYNYLIQDNYQIDKLLKQLISKYPGKVEAYLYYWQLLISGKFKNYELANSISEVYWKNSSTIHFDDGIFYLYILITHAKSSYLVGNHFYSITYFQKEYPSNFLFPSLYYLFGKYSSKSKSKSLKNITISSLKEVFRLLYEDLQYSVLYWLGNIYYITGHFDECFKVWKNYLEHADKSFDVSHKKIERIKTFLKSYEIIWNSLNEFKKNLKFLKKLKIVNSYKDFKDKDKNNNNINLNDNSTNFQSNTFNHNSTTNLTPKMNQFLKTLQSIKDLENNQKLNKSIQYDYYKALCYFYIENNHQEAIKILMNIIHHKKHSMKSLHQIWKILYQMKQYKLLLNFSYFIIKISHLNEVSFSDWIKSYKLYSRALMLNNKNDEAIILLINLLDLFAVLPLEDAKYLNDIYKQNKISTTNFFVNFDKALQFYSKYQVYRKSQAIFQINYTLKKSKKNAKSEKFVLSLNDIDVNGNIIIQNSLSNNNTINFNENNFQSTSNINSNINSNFNSNFNEASNLNQNLTNDIEIDSFYKLEEYIEKNIDLIEVPNESPFLTIVSNPDILLQIGKSCAKSECKRELGLMCLQDFVMILKFVNNYKLNEKNDKKKQKAYFWMSILHIQMKHYNLAKECIDKIDKLYEFDTFKKKSKIVKMFIDYYKQFICLNDSVGYEFEISKEDLQ